MRVEDKSRDEKQVMETNREIREAFKKWIEAEDASISAFGDFLCCVAVRDPEKALEIAEAVARSEQAATRASEKQSVPETFVGFRESERGQRHCVGRARSLGQRSKQMKFDFAGSKAS